jgi:DNA-binding PadR family transcriptional regulator
MDNKALLKGNTQTLILSLLNQKNMYGYEIIKKLEIRSNELFNLKEGTLYPILHSLEKSKYIESYWEKTETKRKRKYYKITENGKKELGKRKNQWNIFQKTMNDLLFN